jgi:predicted nucleic acid-binding protein
MTFLPDTNACIMLLRGRNPRLISRWQAVKASEIALCSVVAYELR